ncbi:hypothetical protein CRG98_028903 [Punica granatum]|uniref:Serpin domain-containing protein n=1 Tax=Punica granatum TaxID=22663 RepID=A0A2I0J3G3_PUNGR|nr:hypothetical protein CRG98_028903 [Punica granatum]
MASQVCGFAGPIGEDELCCVKSPCGSTCLMSALSVHGLLEEEVTNEVNSWIEKQTSGLIKEVLPVGGLVPDLTRRLIFVNALYFKGAWNEKFDLSCTKDAEFHLLSGSCSQVPFMTSKKKQTVSAFDGFKVLELPCKQGSSDKRRFSMYFFLPDETKGLPSLVKKVCSEPGFLDHHLPRQKVEVRNFRIPRFKISFGFEAVQVLEELGMFFPESLGLAVSCTQPHENLYVSKLFNRSFIEVNEEGSEAAAASTVLVNVKGPKKIDFVADHPFLFIIRENMSGMILFIGQVLNPSTI